LNFFDVEAVLILAEKLHVDIHLEFSNELSGLKDKILLNQQEKNKIGDLVKQRLLENSFLEAHLNHAEFFQQVD